MRARFLAIPALALTTLGCDAVTETLAEARETVASSGSTERPAGWESIEDEASAIRLYYQFVDGRGRRFRKPAPSYPRRDIYRRATAP
jgi:hypothetical protein